EIDAVLAGNLRGDGKPDQLFRFAVELAVGIELDRFELVPRSGDPALRELPEEAGNDAERLLDVLIGRFRSGRLGILAEGGGECDRGHESKRGRNCSNGQRSS